MKSSHRRILTLLGVVLILVFSFLGMKFVKNKQDELQKAKVGIRDLAVPVQTGRVGRACIDNLLTFNGDIQALQSVDVQPKVSGRLKTLVLPNGGVVEEGTIVKQGELIATIDDRDIHAQVSSAKAALAAAEANVSASKAEITSGEAGLLNSQASVEQKKAALLAAGAAKASAKTLLADKERELARQKGLIERQATTQQNYDQAETAFAQAQAALRQAEAEEKSKEAEVRSSEAAIQQAQASLEKARAGLAQAEAAFQQAQAALEQAEVNYSETKLYAPMDGVVSKKYVDPGAMVSPTTPIVTIVSMEEVKVLLSVPVNYLPMIVPGKTQARMRTVSLPGKSIDCRVAKIYPAISLDTRTAQVELRIKNTLDPVVGYELKPGMYATVEMLVESKHDVVAIDVSLPIRNLNRQLVYVVEGDKVRAVDVKLGIRFKQQVEILDGLKGGEEIVVVGQHRLTDGAAIKRIEGNNLQMPDDVLDTSNISGTAE